MAYDERPWLSVSRLKANDCGKRYQLEKIEKVPSRPAAWTVRGIASHDVIETWEKSDRSIDPQEYFHEEAWEKAFDLCKEKYPDVDDWIRTPRVKTVEIDLQRRKAEALKYAENYVDHALDDDSWRVIETEMKFNIDYDDLVVIGYIDQVREYRDGVLEIVDIKTSSNDDREDKRQLGVYALGYWNMTGTPVKQGAYMYPKLQRYSKIHDLRHYTMDYVHEQFQILDRQLSSNLFLPNPSIKGCFSCPVSRHCLESMWND